MRVTDVLTSPWAILPERLQEICAIYRAHAHGEKADLAAIEAAIGRTLDNQAKGYEVIDRVAVVPLEGVIAKRMNIFSRISGGVSTQLFQRDILAAADDPEAHSIVVLVDSPGGTVDGTQAAMQAIRAAREQKQVVVVVDGLGASAAYWIASAAERIYIVDDTTEVGSIGVVASHQDWSRYEENLGVKTTEITAGKYKRIASEHAPLTQEGRASIQDQVDQIYTIFVNDVAANRGRDVETVLKDMADGRLFIGRKAVEAGLVDGIRSLQAVIAALNDPRGLDKLGAHAPKTGGQTMEKVMICGVECTTQEAVDSAVKAAIDKAVAESQAAAAADLESKVAGAKAAGIADGAATERARILAVEENSMPGHEKLVAEMKADGKTTGPEAAVRILQAEKAKTGQIAKDLAADAPDPAPAAERTESDAKPKDPDARELARQAREYVDAEAKAGRSVRYADAVSHVIKQQ
jgi:signal peptide peptidase SppA